MSAEKSGKKTCEIKCVTYTRGEAPQSSVGNNDGIMPKRAKRFLKTPCVVCGSAYFRRIESGCDDDPHCVTVYHHINFVLKAIVATQRNGNGAHGSHASHFLNYHRLGGDSPRTYARWSPAATREASTKDWKATYAHP